MTFNLKGIALFSLFYQICGAFAKSALKQTLERGFVYNVVFHYLN